MPPRNRTSSTVSQRPSTPDDEAFLQRLYVSTRQDEPSLRSWSKAHREKFLGMQYETQRDSYRQSYPTANHWIILVNDRSAGHFVINETASDLRLVDISLLPEHRGHGVGGRILRRLLDNAAAQSKTVSLHVFRESPARRLYESLGFREGPSSAPGRAFYLWSGTPA